MHDDYFEADGEVVFLVESSPFGDLRLHTRLFSMSIDEPRRDFQLSGVQQSICINPSLTDDTHEYRMLMGTIQAKCRNEIECKIGHQTSSQLAEVVS